MKIIFKAFLIFACAISLFASAPETDRYKSEIEILKELDIDASFAKTARFAQLVKNIKGSHIETFTNALKEGYMYIPTIKAQIKAAGLPDSFFYLAMIESGFSNHAVSNVKAVGVWQFMTQTAKSHGLAIDEYVDERRDPIRATTAATTYLKSLKKRFGKWYLAAMAYNCGSNCLSKAIKKAKTDDFATLIDPSKKYLSAETRHFVTKILRAAYIAKDAEFLLPKDSALLNINGGLKLTKVSVSGGTSLLKIGDSIGLSVKKMKANNPHLKVAFAPPNTKNYHIYIPESKKELFAQNFKPSNGKSNFYTYIVKKSDTLLGIAKKAGISHRVIKDYNELTSNSIKINQKLFIPALNSDKPQRYIVQSNDTLATISKKFNVTQKEIKEANSLASSDLDIGVSIVIP